MTSQLRNIWKGLLGAVAIAVEKDQRDHVLYFHGGQSSRGTIAAAAMGALLDMGLEPKRVPNVRLFRLDRLPKVLRHFPVEMGIGWPQRLEKALSDH